MPVKIAAMIAKNDGTLPFVMAKSDVTYDSKNCNYAIKKCCHT